MTKKDSGVLVPETPKLDVHELIRKDKDKKRKKLKITMTFGEYLKLLEKDPSIAQNSPSRFDEIVEDAGVEKISEDEYRIGSKATKRYMLFKDLFGIDDVVSSVVSHIKAGKNRSSTGKHLLLMPGPPGSGKSTIVKILCRALENYDKKRIFRIKGCPINEEPLHLLPREELRPEVGQKLGIAIEGDLCPVCRHLLMSSYTDHDEDGDNVRWQDVPVESFTFSEQSVRGITSFAPSDERTSDITALTVRERVGITSNPNKGYESPDAFDIGGLIGRAQRGIFEAREVCSNDPSILSIFFSLCEEKQMMVPGATNFPHISIDTFTVGHTNLSVYRKFSANKDMEGLHNRFFIVACPYILTVKDEVRLYRKLIEQESEFISLQKKHIAPGSLELAALFAVITRITPSSMGISLITKAKLYNGDKTLLVKNNRKSTFDLRALWQEGQNSPDISKRDGMFGLSPRDILAALNIALVEDTEGCLTPLSTIQALRNVFNHRVGIEPEMIEKYLAFLVSGSEDSIIAELREFTTKAVNRAFLRAHDDFALEQFENYMEELEVDAAEHMNFFNLPERRMKIDPISGKPKEADQKLLRSVEIHIPINESEAPNFRGDTLKAKAILGKSFSYETYSPLARAVEKKLLEENKSLLRIVLKKDLVKDDNQTKRAADMFDELTHDEFCQVCAKEIMEEAGKLLT